MTPSAVCISPEEAKRTRGIMFFEGIIQIVLGLAFLSAPGASLLILARFIGIYWLIRGVVFIVQMFGEESQGYRFWYVVAGVLGVVSGLIVLGHPLFSVFLRLGIILFFIIVTGLVQGIINIAQSFQRGFWYMMLGSLQMILAIFLMFNPLVGIAALPVILGVIMGLGGVMSIYYGITFKERLGMPVCD